MIEKYKEMLVEQGFVIVPQLVPKAMVQQAVATIASTLAQYAQALSLPLAHYLYCTGRWGSGSMVTASLDYLFHRHIAHYLQQGEEGYIVKKSNVICKTADLTDAIPFHQDISYNAQDPYHFSIWLALNDIDEDIGGIQVIPKSHDWPVMPPVDFWQPDYIDNYVNLYGYQIKTITLAAGDGLLFDARLWHGSGQNLAQKDRFAYVTRWVIQNQSFPFIPQPMAATFGMFNCGMVTERILKAYIVDLEAVNLSRAALIPYWLAQVDNIGLPEAVDRHKAKKALYHLWILEQATALQDAGDISGKIYKTLWSDLLQYLPKNASLFV